MQWHNWQQLFGEARTRISVSYLILMLVFTGISVPAIRQVLFSRVQARIERSLDQEVEEFRRLSSGQNPKTGQSFGNDAAAIFDVFLSRNIPGNDEFLLTILDGELYQYSPRALPELLQPDSDLIQQWAAATKSEQGSVNTSAGTILYRVEPLIIDRQKIGVFVIANTTIGERKEVEEVV
ncbi:MAG: two-component sensor histidine kinase, partial [Microcoleus sp. SIO2G3]|nr:two-component sensor histidine kinase [Microcoleus sp. SIO2G3]